MSDPIIRFESVEKTFRRGSSSVAAVVDVDLEIERGEVFAFIGFSGAGKSTLVRLINGLEQPTGGTITVAGKDLNRLSAKEIRALRADIGMVFQQFNLLRSRTVYGNVAFPLEIAGWSAQKQKARITELLHFVGLTERAWAYPEELSGGQKQRVGIARALATNPEILLADEATSALDPDTTRDVLALLRRVNEEFGTTVVVITHEMEVVRTLADRVAVLDSGRVVESGPVREVFAAPKAEATRRLIGATLDNRPDDIEWAQLQQRYAGRLVTATPYAGKSLGAVIGSAAARGVGLEIVHGGVTRIKTSELATFTFELTGEDLSLDAFIHDLQQVATVTEGAA
ncbi:methionine ABC transporter ATP-binding protein [Calidifontibacter terrae]